MLTSLRTVEWITPADGPLSFLCTIPCLVVSWMELVEILLNHLDCDATVNGFYQMINQVRDFLLEPAHYLDHFDSCTG